MCSLSIRAIQVNHTSVCQGYASRKWQLVCFVDLLLNLVRGLMVVNFGEKLGKKKKQMI